MKRLYCILGFWKSNTAFRYIDGLVAFGLLPWCRGKVVVVKPNAELIQLFSFELLLFFAPPVYLHAYISFLDI